MRFYITTGFVVLGVGAYLIRAAGASSPRRGIMLSMTLWLLSVLVPLQIFLGDAAWPEHAGASAGQARGDRGASGTRAAASR